VLQALIWDYNPKFANVKPHKQKYLKFIFAKENYKDKKIECLINKKAGGKGK